jgi:Fe(II)/alpha-ketoglutarate-dependent arginine beta-hydroxylase
MIRYQLASAEAAAVKAVCADLAATYDSVEDENFLAHSVTYVHDLPVGLREFLSAFRLTECSPVCVVAGYEVDDQRIGPTPSHWGDGALNWETRATDMYFFLCACLLGYPIAWSTQQGGRVMHDVLPIKEHEWEQIGSGSREVLTWHTEDAFHPLRADYIGLLGLRNPDLVKTTYAGVDDVMAGGGLSPQTLGCLREPIYPIHPDRSHLPINRVLPGLPGRSAELIDRCYEWIMALDAHPEPVPVFSGAEDMPYLRLDPYFMDLSPEAVSPQGARAISELCDQIEANIKTYCIEPGDVLFLDNYRAVHGRQAFRARFDGTDRWLKRLNIARDLRKSRARRLSPESRVIY